jgi:di/tricarboxylate transporter
MMGQWLARAIAGGALAVGAVLFFVPAPAGIAPSVMPAAALAVSSIGFWATGVLPGHITAIAFFLFAMLFKVAPAPVIFSGFHSTALWLIFGGLVIGVAVQRSGLGERFARALAARSGASYVGIITGIVAVSTAMPFFMPSTMGRVLILTPIVLAFADRLGFAAGSRGRTGMALAAMMATLMSGFAILPANVPNMVLMGASETLYGFVPVYGEYLLLHFPVTGALKSVALVACICLLFPDRPRPAPEVPTAATGGEGERRLMIILAVALVLWATDFLHHISPAWIALGAAFVCLLPRVGMLPAKVFNGEIDYGSLFYVAGLFGLGAMVAQSGLGDLLARALVETVDFTPGEHGRNFIAVSLIATLLALVTTSTALAAVMTPLAAGIAEATGLPLDTVLMTEVIGFSTIMLPYQSAPIVVVMQIAGVRARDGVSLTLMLGAIALFVLLPLNYLWWSLLGVIP